MLINYEKKGEKIKINKNARKGEHVIFRCKIWLLNFPEVKARRDMSFHCLNCKSKHASSLADFSLNSGENIRAWGSCEMSKWMKSSIILCTFVYFVCPLDPQHVASFQRFSFQDIFVWSIEDFVLTNKNSYPKLRTCICVTAWKSIWDTCLEMWITLPNFVIS